MLDLLLNSSPLKTAYSLSKKNGLDIFLVGGSVRDLHIAGSLGTDLDFLVDGDARPIAQQFANLFKGASFCLDKKRGYYRAVKLQGENITTADFSTLLESNLIQNLMDRDFTINAIGIRLADVFEKRKLTCIDPSNGLGDLRAKHIRATSPHALRDDPLRILRAIRFTAQCHFTLDPLTERQIDELKIHLLTCPRERIRNEFFLILSQQGSPGSLSQLDRHGILALLLPEWNRIKNVKPHGIHGDSLREHALKTVHATELILKEIDHYFPQQAESLKVYFGEEIEEGIQRRTLLIFASVLHFLYHTGPDGMSRTTPPLNKNGLLTMNIRKIARRLRLSRQTERTITSIVRYSLQIPDVLSPEALPERSCYRFMKDINGPVPDTLILARAYVLAAGPGEAQCDTCLPDGETVQMLMGYYFQEFSRNTPAPLLCGDDIMRVLDLKPGKKVGDLLEIINAAERGGTISTKEDALKLLISAVKRE